MSSSYDSAFDDRGTMDLTRTTVDTVQRLIRDGRTELLDGAVRRPSTALSELERERRDAPVSTVRLRTASGVRTCQVRRTEPTPGTFVHEVSVPVLVRVPRHMSDLDRDWYFAAAETGVETVFNQGFPLPGGDQLRIVLDRLHDDRAEGFTLRVGDAELGMSDGDVQAALAAQVGSFFDTTATDAPAHAVVG